MFVLELWDDECAKTTFYTVRKDGAEHNEMDKFLLKFRDKPGFEKAVRQLNALILLEIGGNYGAKEAFFNRPEEGSFGLPPKGTIRMGQIRLRYKNFPLRLYAIRVEEREDLVVLFNGGAKESGTNIDSPELHHVMQEAKMFAKKITAALHEGAIEIDEKNLKLRSADGEEEIVIH
ncbi:MAG TPA: hypothetical protein VK826_01380 [Bacteroidia bacterium]|nr:hypothetical protein [Bacteroidia bacterium]